jgi:hypothetical protein
MNDLAKHTQTALHLTTAAVAGPALIWAGFVYPGSKKAKIFLSVTGALVLISHYAYFDSALRRSE